MENPEYFSLSPPPKKEKPPLPPKPAKIKSSLASSPCDGDKLNYLRNTNEERSRSRCLTKGVDIAGKVDKYERISNSRSNSAEGRSQSLSRNPSSVSAGGNNQLWFYKDGLRSTSSCSNSLPRKSSVKSVHFDESSTTRRNKNCGEAKIGRSKSINAADLASLVRVSSVEINAPKRESAVIVTKRTRSTSPNNVNKNEEMRKKFLFSAPPKLFDGNEKTMNVPANLILKNPPKRPPRKNSPSDRMRSRTPPTPPPRTNSPSMRKTDLTSTNDEKRDSVASSKSADDRLPLQRPGDEDPNSAAQPTAEEIAKPRSPSILLIEGEKEKKVFCLETKVLPRNKVECIETFVDDDDDEEEEDAYEEVAAAVDGGDDYEEMEGGNIHGNLPSFANTVSKRERERVCWFDRCLFVTGSFDGWMEPSISPRCRQTNKHAKVPLLPSFIYFINCQRQTNEKIRSTRSMFAFSCGFWKTISFFLWCSGLKSRGNAINSGRKYSSSFLFPLL